MKLIKAVVVTCLLLVYAEANELENARTEYKNFTAKEIAKSMSETLASMAPLKIDAITTIVGAMSVDSTIIVSNVISQNELSDLIKDDVQKMTKKEKDKFISNMIGEMYKLHANTLCTTPDTKVALEKGVDFSYQYKWDDFTYFGKVNIDNKSCKNIKL